MQLEYQKTLDKIKKIIAENPRGTTIKDIVDKVGINRNVIAKYLDVLIMTGDIDGELYGRSKVYYPAKSIPISKMADYTNDFILVVRKDLTAAEINNPFVKYLGLPTKEKIMGKPIQKLPLNEQQSNVTQNITEALTKQKIREEKIEYTPKRSQKPDHFQVKYIPTTFSDGERGVTVILSKILEEE